MGKNNKNNKYANRWSAEDRQNFADRNILRAQTIQGKRFGGAEVDEWDWDAEDDLTAEGDEDDFPCLCWDVCLCA